MADIIFTASIIASFLAGMVALFAPCCITVLLPAYLASAFREKRNILKMTFIFFGGISVILIPIGLGAAWLAQFFRDFHKEMYITGGLLMVVLAGMAIAGRGLAMLPMTKRIRPAMKGHDAKAVFLLGLFSGAATSCCAPVLAGAVTLAVISGTFGKALIVTFAYVFGMTFPLFITAYFYDRLHLERTKFIRGRLWRVSWGGKRFVLHSTNLLAGLVFLVMGVILLILGFSGNAFWSPVFQAKLGEALNQWSRNILKTLTKVPDIIWGLLMAGIFLFFMIKAKKNSRRQPYELNKK